MGSCAGKKQQRAQGRNQKHLNVDPSFPRSRTSPISEDSEQTHSVLGTTTLTSAPDNSMRQAHVNQFDGVSDR